MSALENIKFIEIDIELDINKNLINIVELADEIRQKRVGHIKNIHSKCDDKCFITIANKEKEYRQRHYKLSEIEESSEAIINDINAYVSMNAFYRTYRRTEYLRQLDTLYIDLDVYNTDYTKEQVLVALKDNYFNTKIPMPNLIMDSGRGIYLIWTLKRTPSKALPLWSAIEKYFYEQLKQFGADSKALDCSRVLRVPGTINSKSNSLVQVLEQYDFQYELRDIQREYLPILEPKEIKKQRKGRKPKLIGLFTLHSLHYARMQDLITLCELRDWKVKGLRETIIFLYRNFSICFTEDKDKALQDAFELNSQFAEPLPNKEVIENTSSAEKTQYKYKNSTLIQLLEITADEQKHMKTIISKSEANEREKAVKKKSRRNEEGLTSREQQKLDKIKAVQELKEQGLNNNQIAQKLAISTRYIRKIING